MIKKLNVIAETAETKYCFVMPLYNASNWMRKAIDSILVQTYCNWELICVDDGSLDDTREIVDVYVNNYNDKIRLITQENSGPAAAREKAIKLTESDYIVFLDSDDYISNDYLVEINKMVFTNPDVIVPELMSQDSLGKFYSFNKKNNLNKGDVFSGAQAFRLTFPWNIHAFACYKISLMKKYAVGDNANFNRYNADEYITRVVFLHSEKIIVSDGIYYHTANSESITTKFSKRQVQFLLTETKLIRLTEKFDNDYVDHVKTDSLKKFTSSYLNFLVNKRSFTKEEAKEISDTYIKFYNDLKTKRFSYERNNSFSKYDFGSRLVKFNINFIWLFVFIKRVVS